MALNAAPAASNIGTALVGAGVAVVGMVSQEAVAQWVGLGLVLWSGLLAAYSKWLDVRREAKRRDLLAELAELEARPRPPVPPPPPPPKDEEPNR